MLAPAPTCARGELARARARGAHGLQRAARAARRRRRRTAVDADGGQGRRLAYARALERGGGRVTGSTAHAALAFGACASVRERARASQGAAVVRDAVSVGEEGKRGHMTRQKRHLRADSSHRRTPAEQ
jgi:hypothetical protein